MQARAILEAFVIVAKKGKTIIPEVMIPLIGGAEELAHQKANVKAVAEEVLGKASLLGKQSGEPNPVEFCYQVGMDYVSCSPTVCRSPASLLRRPPLPDGRLLGSRPHRVVRFTTQ